jgi:pilus assembly protein CpaB
MVEILVASAPINAGTSAQDAADVGALEKRPFLAKSVRGLRALSDITPIATQVALSPIAVGEPILATQFGPPGESSRLPIPAGKIAVSVQLADPARVAGFVGPDSQVAIFLTAPNPAGQQVTRLLVSPVRVIATGDTTIVPVNSGAGSAAPNQGVAQAILTLAVSQTEAQKIVFGSQQGQLYFGLLGRDSKLDSSDEGASAKNLYP